MSATGADAPAANAPLADAVLDAPPLPGPVLVVGTGLLGTSVGLALRSRGVEVWLADRDPEHVRTATGLGAGHPRPSRGTPALVVVAVPPDHVGEVVVAALAEHASAVVTDVGSVKATPLAQVRARAAATDLARYVGSHPLAGSERSGPLAGSAVLFEGRPWAITPHAEAGADAVRTVEGLVRACGATPFTYTPEEHDAAVARTSHLPHVMAAVVAAALADAPGDHLALSGQGVRDVTRVAAGDPGLWQQILGGNATAVAPLLAAVREQLAAVEQALLADDRAEVARVLSRGVAGTRAIPGKHGGPAQADTGVFVVVPDHPGELARLFADVGEIGTNIEDVHIDHDPGRPVGVVELRVAAAEAERLLAALEARGWAGHR